MRFDCVMSRTCFSLSSGRARPPRSPTARPVGNGDPRVVTILDWAVRMCSLPSTVMASSARIDVIRAAAGRWTCGFRLIIIRRSLRNRYNRVRSRLSAGNDGIIRASRFALLRPASRVRHRRAARVLRARPSPRWRRLGWARRCRGVHRLLLTVLTSPGGVTSSCAWVEALVALAPGDPEELRQTRGGRCSFGQDWCPDALLDRFSRSLANSALLTCADQAVRGRGQFASERAGFPGNREECE